MMGKDKNHPSLMKDETLARIAVKLGKTPPQVRSLADPLA
jgi:hypothetical protein